MTCKSRFLIFVVLFSLLASSITAQQAPVNQKRGDDVLKINSELVQVDVLVTDKDGKPVPGLKREDFQLFDNDKKQSITTFAYEEARARAIADDPDQIASLPRSISARELRRVIAFVVDTIHMRFDSVHRTRQMLEQFVEKQMSPGDLVLILPTGGGSGLFQQFTADQRLLRRAISRLRSFTIATDASPQRTLFGPRMTGGFPTLGRPPIQPIGGTPDPVVEYDVRATLSTLNNLTKTMGKLPGRKVSVFISEGCNVRQTQTTYDLNDTIRRAASANVVFYSIDPRGLQDLNVPAGDGVSGQDLAQTLEDRRNDYFDSQDALSSLAVNTGGKFFRNNNDIKQGLARVLEENSAYYVLGFQPEGKWDGKFRKLKVTVPARPELKISTRRGYLARTASAVDPKIKDPRLAEIVEALSSPLVRRDIDVQLTPFYRDNEQREPLLMTLLHIDATRLNFKEVEGRYQTKLEMIGHIFDSRAKAVDSFSNTLDLNLRPESYQEALKRGLLVTQTKMLKPGAYQARIFLRETGSGLIGTANDIFEIPKLNGDRLALSSIFTDARALDGARLKDAGEGATLSQRRFKQGTQFAYMLLVYNAKTKDKSNEVQLEIRTRILRGLRVAYTGEQRPMQLVDGSTPPTRMLTGGFMQLGNLPPDDYTLEITIIDKLRKKDGVVRQEIDFSIE